MRIAFVLPGPARKPGGGIRVVYRLAESLSARGHCVRILHPLAWLGCGQERKGPWRVLSFLKHRFFRDFIPGGWVPLPKGVSLELIPSVRANWIGSNDAVIATGWRTIDPVANLPDRCGARFALIQSLEDWDGGRDAVVDALGKPLSKISISRWVAEELESIGQESMVIPNGIDHDLFFVEQPPAERSEPVVSFMWSDLAFKGAAYTLDAMRILRSSYPSLRVEVFGIASPSESMPEWVSFVENPSADHLRGIYNSAKIFVAPSFSEGWDLPACEAMACGAALVASQIPVREEYATHGKDCILFAPGDIDAVVHGVSRLLDDDTLRIQLAESGLSRVADLTWSRSALLFERALREVASMRLDKQPPGTTLQEEE